jgi:CRP-like cAMP-binding protein
MSSMTTRQEMSGVGSHAERKDLPSGKGVSGAGTRKKEAERDKDRRRSMPGVCRKCDARRVCPFSRARWFQAILRTHVYGRDTTLVRQGEPARLILVIHRGWVQATHVMPNGKSISDLLGPGSVIGIASSMVSDTFPYTAIALEECEVHQADAESVLRHLRRDPGATLDLLRFVSRQFQRLHELFYGAAGKTPSDERLLETLREIAAACGVPAESGTRIPMPLPVQLLADRIGCSRQWASKLLGQLERRGAIQRHRSWITLVGAAPSRSASAPAFSQFSSS